MHDVHDRAAELPGTAVHCVKPYSMRSKPRQTLIWVDNVQFWSVAIFYEAAGENAAALVSGTCQPVGQVFGVHTHQLGAPAAL